MWYRCCELLWEIAISKEMRIYTGSISRDRIHMLIGISPNMSVSKAVQYLKGKSSHKLMSEYKALKRRYWGHHMRAGGYWVATSGNVTDEVWMEYIKNQRPPEPDDEFHRSQTPAWECIHHYGTKSTSLCLQSSYIHSQ